MKLFLKSLLAGIFGASLFFSFFMTIAIAALALVDRFHTSVEYQSVVITPLRFLREVGFPLSAAAFVFSFVLGWRRFRRSGSAALEVHPLDSRSRTG